MKPSAAALFYGHGLHHIFATRSLRAPRRHAAWHGAEWQFVVWGGIHGTLLVAERIFRERGYRWRLPAVSRPVFTFALVLLTWVFFRADGLAHALRYLGSMFALWPTADSASLLAAIVYRPFSVAVLGAAAAIVWAAPQTHELIRWSEGTSRQRTVLALAIPVLLAVSLLEMTTQAHNPFLYFRF